MFLGFWVLSIDMVHCFSFQYAAAIAIPWIFTKVGIGPQSPMLFPQISWYMIYFLMVGLLMTMASRSCLSVTSASSSAMMGEM